MAYLKSLQSCSKSSPARSPLRSAARPPTTAPPQHWPDPPGLAQPPLGPPPSHFGSVPIFAPPTFPPQPVVQPNMHALIQQAFAQQIPLPHPPPFPPPSGFAGNMPPLQPQPPPFPPPGTSGPSMAEQVAAAVAAALPVFLREWKQQQKDEEEKKKQKGWWQPSVSGSLSSNQPWVPSPGPQGIPYTPAIGAIPCHSRPPVVGLTAKSPPAQGGTATPTAAPPTPRPPLTGARYPIGARRPPTTTSGSGSSSSDSGQLFHGASAAQTAAQPETLGPCTASNYRARAKAAHQQAVAANAARAQQAAKAAAKALATDPKAAAKQGGTQMHKCVASLIIGVGW